MDAGVKQVKLTTLEVEAHGDAAHEVGTYVLMGDGGKQLDSGKYVVVWKKRRRAVEAPPGHLEHEHARAEVGSGRQLMSANAAIAQRFVISSARSAGV